MTGCERRTGNRRCSPTVYATIPWVWGLAVLLVVVFVEGCGGRSISGDSDGGSSGLDGGIPECLAPGDCLVAWRADECCSCPEPVSLAEVLADDCLIPPEQSYVPPECWVDCSMVDCAGCLQHEWTATCAGGRCAWLEGECTAPEDCVVGVRVDDCCTRAQPVSQDALQDDPCLVPWPVFEVPEICRDQWAVDCDYINCTWSGPETRAVSCGADGCAHVPECAAEEDCTLVLDGNAICPCPEGYPADMLGRDECVVPASSAIPQHCPANQVLADCGPCWIPDSVICAEAVCTAVTFAAQQGATPP